jgi:hypothetical protein
VRIITVLADSSRLPRYHFIVNLYDLGFIGIHMTYLRIFFGILLFCATALAQNNTPPAAIPAIPPTTGIQVEKLPSAPEPSSNLEADEVADRFIQNWAGNTLPKRVPQPLVLNNPKTIDSDLAAYIRDVFRSQAFSAVPEGVRVSYRLRQLTREQPKQRIYSYPTTSNQLGDEQMRLTLELQGKSWQAVELRPDVRTTLIPDWVNTDLGNWFFVAFSAFLGWASFAKTAWRTALLSAWAMVRSHWWLYIGTNALLYGLFLLLSSSGMAFPESVGAMRESLLQALIRNEVQNLLAGGIGSAAFGISFNNFMVGIVFYSFVPGLFFGIPAYIANAMAFMVYGFALSPVGMPAALYWLHIPTIIVELQAYILVVTASGIFLWRIVASRFGKFREAWQGYWGILPLAITVLIVAAWYEAIELMVLLPLFR